VNGVPVSSSQSYIQGLELALSKVEKHIIKLQNKAKKALKNEITDADKITLQMVNIFIIQILDDPVFTNMFEDYLEEVGRDYLFQFWRYISDFREELRIEFPIFSLNDTINTKLWESWEWSSIAFKLMNTWATFFAPDSNLNISGLLSNFVKSHLESFYNSFKDKNPMTTISKNECINAVKVALMAENEVLEIFRAEDLPSFLIHPIGQKMVSYYFNPPSKEKSLNRFLRPKSPDRQDSSRLSHDGSTTENEDHEDVRRGLLDLFKRRGSKNNLPKISWTEEKDKLSVSGSNEELSQLVNSNDSIYKSSQAKSPQKPAHTLSVPGEELEKSSFMKSILKRTKSPDRKIPRIQSNPNLLGSNLSLDVTGLQAPKSAEISVRTPNSAATVKTIKYPESDVEKLLSLELEDVNPSPIDESIIIHDAPLTNAPMIVLPKTFFELDKELLSLEKDLEEVDASIRGNSSSSGPAKMMLYSRAGILHEMQAIKEEKQAIEKSEIDNVLRPVIFD
jgi:hypothetical protein